MCDPGTDTLKKLIVKNFESHKDTSVVFSPGINIITGDTDVGKSSLRRACEWVVCNRPLGTEFINWDSKSSSVILDEVEKYRSQSGKHFYKCRGITYKAFGHGVPGAVTRELRLSDENIQGQHDPYFLLKDSPGQVARVLNSVTDLSLIDRCLKEGKKRIRKTITRMEVIGEQTDEREAKRKSLLWTEEAIKETAQYEQLVKTDRDLYTQIRELEVLVEKARNPRLKVLSSLPTDLARVKAGESKEKNLEAEITLLQTLISQAKAFVYPSVSKDLEQVQGIRLKLSESEIQALEPLIRKASPVSLPLAAKDAQALRGARDRSEDLKTQIAELETQVETLKDSSAELKTLSEDYKQQKKAFDLELKSLGICPLCGGEL